MASKEWGKNTYEAMVGLRSSVNGEGNRFPRETVKDSFQKGNPELEKSLLEYVDRERLTPLEAYGLFMSFNLYPPVEVLILIDLSFRSYEAQIFNKPSEYKALEAFFFNLDELGDSYASSNGALHRKVLGAAVNTKRYKTFHKVVRNTATIQSILKSDQLAIDQLKEAFSLVVFIQFAISSFDFEDTWKLQTHFKNTLDEISSCSSADELYEIDDLASELEIINKLKGQEQIAMYCEERCTTVLVHQSIETFLRYYRDWRCMEHLSLK